VENGFRRILRASPSFRIGAFLAALTVAGLYTATRLVWGIAFALHELSQVAAFYVAWHVIRTGRDARLTLLAFVVGLLPAVALGLQQSSMPVRFFQETVGSVPAIAWDEAGNPHVRVFSTFEHPLHFSHALSTAVGLGAGSWREASPGAGFAVLAVVAAIGYCNQYTYSIGGLLGTAAGLLAAVFPVAPAVARAARAGRAPGLRPRGAARLPAAHRVQLLGQEPHHRGPPGDLLPDVRGPPGPSRAGRGWGSIRTTLEQDYRITREKMVAFTAENYFLQRALASGLVGLGLSIALCLLFFRNARARAPDDPSPWPRSALLAGSGVLRAGPVHPGGGPTSRYVLWTLFALAERMRLAARAAAPAPRGEE